MTAPSTPALRVAHPGFGADAVEYQDAWDLQRRVHADVVAGRTPDTVLLLEHPPVYTAGRRTEPFERPLDGTPVVDVDRGGKITWHGPGQLVGYPIVRLPEPDRRRRPRAPHRGDAHRRVRRSSASRPARSRGAAGCGCRPTTGARTARSRPSASASAEGVTMHGFALNCDTDLAWFDRIVPCGIRDAEVTTLSRELGPGRDGGRGAARRRAAPARRPAMPSRG